METVKVKKNELLATIIKNRAEHKDIFLEAQKGFRETAIRILDERLAEARKGKRINLSFSLPEPVDHTPDYDRIIKMLNMSTDDIVELTDDHFAQYVMDDWSWKRQWFASNVNYSAKAKEYHDTQSC